MAVKALDSVVTRYVAVCYINCRGREWLRPINGSDGVFHRVIVDGNPSCLATSATEMFIGGSNFLKTAASSPLNTLPSHIEPPRFLWRVFGFGY